MIQIISDITSQEGTYTYRSIELASEKKSISVMVVTAKYPYVGVIVNNAAHQAWRGAGKTFKDIDEAIANYKSADIKAMLEYVKGQN